MRAIVGPYMRVKVRGESMQAAADATPSGMASIIGLSSDKAGWA